MRKSKGELYIEEILQSLNIDYERQKRFKDCKNKKQLPFDFYISNHNICIEYDGEQHYKPIDFWGGETRFLERQLNDKIKNDYCSKNNITLLRIPYTKSKQEIFEIINNLISPATITA